MSKLKTENDGLKSEIIKLKNQIKVIQTSIQTPPSVIESAPCKIIDLGFSDLLWADRNIGANSPTDYGDYFAWGEIQPKDTYSWVNYKYCKDGDSERLTKYCNNKENGYRNFTDGLIELITEDDAATQNWGNGWKMPTMAEFQSLFENCDWKWTNKDGVNGCEFTSKKNGNEIFFPAAGSMWPTLSRADSRGYYWSSTLSLDRQDCAQRLGFGSGKAGPGCARSRYYGFPVRPVLRKN